MSDATRCACARCRKTGAWGVVAPAAGFRLLDGEDALEPVADGACGLRMRCARCGVEPFSLLEDEVSVNVRCLDELALTG